MVHVNIIACFQRFVAGVTADKKKIFDEKSKNESFQAFKNAKTKFNFSFSEQIRPNNKCEQ